MRSPLRVDPPVRRTTANAPFETLPGLSPSAASEDCNNQVPAKRMCRGSSGSSDTVKAYFWTGIVSPVSVDSSTTALPLTKTQSAVICLQTSKESSETQIRSPATSSSLVTRVQCESRFTHTEPCMVAISRTKYFSFRSMYTLTEALVMMRRKHRRPAVM